MIKLVIKGAVYFNDRTEEILIPHYTGEFSIVDCDRYITIDELKSNYNERYINGVKDNFIENDGIKYYYAEYSPVYTENMELLSDLSKLAFIKEDFDF